MTPEKMAALHARAMVIGTPWSEDAFSNYTSKPTSCVVLNPNGFALGQLVIDEVELLTVAVDPHHQRCGLGRHLLGKFEARALGMGAAHAFLEVASTNKPARKLYLSSGWSESGIRQGYYPSTSGQDIDAILMSKALRQV